jgi:hypothetical protein
MGHDILRILNPKQSSVHMGKIIIILTLLRRISENSFNLI